MAVTIERDMLFIRRTSKVVILSSKLLTGELPLQVS
jgi:hypothetical protein